MVEYCVQELNFTEAAAYKRIQVARSIREFPALFTALAEGRLNLTGVLPLGPHLTGTNVEDLIGAATRLRKFEIEELIAQRFPRADLPARVQPQAVPPTDLLAPGRVDEAGSLAPGRVDDRLGQAEAPKPQPRVTPLAPERFALQVTIGKATHDKLRQAQELLRHALPSGDLEQVLDRALDALITKLEKRKFGATDRPRQRPQRTSTSKRHIPVHVRRAVRERDQGQCTFVNDTGHRCSARKLLELDHIDPVARGGAATVENIRLRCRAHNQFEADCMFGSGFMHKKRARTPRVEVGNRQQVPVRKPEATAVGEQTGDVIAGLQGLGFRTEEARRAALLTEACPAELAERVRAALKFLAPRVRVENRLSAAVAIRA
jgi:hypothetical protein